MEITRQFIEEQLNKIEEHFKSLQVQADRLVGARNALHLIFAELERPVELITSQIREGSQDPS